MNKEDEIRKLRTENDERIIEHRNRDINWDHFKHLVDGWYRTGHNMDRKKTLLQPKDRLKYEVRDKGLCNICGSTFHYGSCNVYLYTQSDYKLSHLHHVIPNGGIDDENIVTLCTHCHQMVHQAMYITGSWKFGRPL